MPHSRAKFLTVRQVAELAGVTERMVRSDIASGRLVSIRQGGRRMIPFDAIKNYRRAPYRSDDLMTVKEFRWVASRGERAIWSAIADGEIPVIRVSKRRLYIPNSLIAEMFGGRQRLQQLLQLMSEVGERRGGRAEDMKNIAR